VVATRIAVADDLRDSIVANASGVSTWLHVVDASPPGAASLTMRPKTS
jgi:hypothetical protein